MPRICEICNKKTGVGASKKHRRGVAGKRWKSHVTPTPRLFRANIQTVTIEEKGKKRKASLCAKCIKRRKKNADNLL